MLRDGAMTLMLYYQGSLTLAKHPVPQSMDLLKLRSISLFAVSPHTMTIDTWH